MSLCPVCGSNNNLDVFKKKGQPRYALQRHTDRQSALKCKKENVHFVYCINCQFAYNKDFDPSKMNYKEDIDASRRYSKYFNDYLVSVCKQINEVFSVRGKRVVEVGCGDGQFLIELRKLFTYKGWGFDPSLIKSGNVPHYKDIKFLSDYYNNKYFNDDPDLIVLRHIVEHIADPKGFLASIISAQGTHPLGIYIEVPSWEWAVAHDQIMMFANDHCSYYSKNSLNLALNLCGFRCERINASFANEYLQYFGEKNSKDAFNFAIKDKTRHLKEYSGRNLNDKTISFIKRIPKILDRFNSYFADTSGNAVLWGAAGKGTMLLSTLGISYKQLPFVVDSNPNRHNTYIPVTGQQVIPPARLRLIQPRYVLITNPNYYREIASQLASLGIKARIITVE